MNGSIPPASIEEVKFVQELAQSTRDSLLDWTSVATDELEAELGVFNLRLVNASGAYPVLTISRGRKCVKKIEPIDPIIVTRKPIVDALKSLWIVARVSTAENEVSTMGELDEALKVLRRKHGR